MSQGETATDTDLRAQLLEAETKLESLQLDFNKQRSKFKDILLTQESELKLQQDNIDSLSADNSAYREQLEVLEHENSEAVEMLKLSQSMDEQEYEKLRSGLEQEQASLRQSYHLQLQEYQAQLQVMSMQKGKWVMERNNLIEELTKLRTAQETTAKPNPTLEDEMSRAQEESSKLKNVVLPLEREIAHLRNQLEQRQKQQQQQQQQHPESANQHNLINFEADMPVSRAQQPDPFLNTILSSKDVTGSDSTPVKMFDPLFDSSSSIGVVQQILDISQGRSEVDTKRETQERIRGLEGEVRDCQLRCTKYEGLLDELRAENYELMDKNASLTGHLSKINKELNRLKTIASKLQQLLSVCKVSLSERPADFSQLDWDIVQEYLRGPLSPPVGTPTGEQLSLLTESPVRFRLEAGSSGRPLCTTPELSGRLVELSEEGGVSLVREELSKARSSLEQLEREKRVLEDEVSSLQASRSSGPMETSQTQKQMTFLKVTVDQQKQTLSKERKVKIEMRKEATQQLNSLKPIQDTYAATVASLTELLSEMREELSIAKKDAQQQIAALMNDREKLLMRIKQIEGGYSSLETQRVVELKDYSVQLNEEKFRKSEAESNVAALEQQLDSLLAAKSKQHSEFGSTLTDKSDEIEKLLREKETVENSFAEEILVHKKQVSEVYQLKTQLEIVQKTKEGLLSENQRLESELAACLHRNELESSRLADANTQLQTEIEAQLSLLREKECAFLLLKKELNTNEEVQRDFVQLSQQLQKQVAELEDDRKVLRWDYEEDTLQCRTCQLQFNMTRRKHRCRHCCRLYCHECSQWTAENQQHKESRVCQACFILLDSPTNVSSLIRKKRASTTGGDATKSN